MSDIGRTLRLNAATATTGSRHSFTFTPTDAGKLLSAIDDEGLTDRRLKAIYDAIDADWFPPDYENSGGPFVHDLEGEHESGLLQALDAWPKAGETALGLRIELGRRAAG